MDPPAAPPAGAGLAHLPAGAARPVARRPLDRRLARRRSHGDRPLPPFRAALGRALAGHRRSRPRPLPAPARRRARVAAGRHLGRAPVGHHRRADRRRCRLSRRPARRRADARHRRRDRAPHAAPADRPGGGRSAQDRHTGRDRPVGDLLALPHRLHRLADRLDDGGPPGPCRDAVAEGPRLHARRQGPGRAARAHHVPPHPAQRRGLAGRRHDAVDRRARPARIRLSPSSASAPSHRRRAGATC